MRHPLTLSHSGRYAEGLVELPGLWSGSDLTAPSGQRPAVLETKGMVGIEADLELGPGQAWIALQLSLASRYKELVRQLIEQGALALAPGALTRPATKSASGLFEILPLAEWAVAPLRVAGGSYAVDASEVARHFEEVGTPLPPSTRAALAAWTQHERNENMRLPDLRHATIDGVPFVDAGGRAQSRYIGALEDANKAELAKSDPGALTKAERERLDAAEAKLAEAMAAHEGAAQRWIDLSARRWKARHERNLVNGVVQRVTRHVPSEADIAVAEEAKSATEALLLRQLIATNRERQEIDSARWWRRREAELAKGR